MQKALKLKVGAKVMLTYNINTCDSLTNGAFGEIVGFDHNINGTYKEVYVHFFNSDCGRETRKKYPWLQEKYPGKNVLGIKPIEFQYSLSRSKSKGLSSALIIQYPLRLAFASTAHKVQGLTVKKPNSLVVDLRSVRESAQAYVILSRVQALSQLYIIESVSEEKITSSTFAIEELDRMEKMAVNLQNKRKTMLLSCNIRSIKKNLDHLMAYEESIRSSVMCLQETWLDPSEPKDLVVNGWKQHNNSVGRGRGISTFFTDAFYWICDISESHYQMTKITSGELDIINVYRSDRANTKSFIQDLLSLITFDKTLIVGDFNLCFKSEANHSIFKSLRGFYQLVKFPTHRHGRIIDLAFYSSSKEQCPYEVEQLSSFFSDHDVVGIYKVSWFHFIIERRFY